MIAERAILSPQRIWTSGVEQPAFQLVMHANPEQSRARVSVEMDAPFPMNAES
jgi:hypothetical protein